MKVILFGATGNLGKCIAAEAVKQGHDVTAVVRNTTKGEILKQTVNCKVLIADVTKASSLEDCCNGFDVVISSLGKSVSINDSSKATFEEIDLHANTSILAEAQKASVKKFIYISAFHAERYPHLTYFNVHQAFSERVMRSGLNYSIIKPPALFSAFTDLFDLARKGRMLHIGKGDKLTNPIYEGDLATICIESIQKANVMIEAGGNEVLTRKQINEIIQDEVTPGKKIRTVPIGFVKSMLPFLKLFNKNMYHKFAFFVEVLQHDTIAPKMGELRLNDYVKMKLKEAN
jgi:uncharacterized protein YbjT (DUF2867 family)